MIFVITNSNVNRDTLTLRIHKLLDCRSKKDTNWIQPCSVHPGFHFGGLVAKSCPTLVTLWAIACQTPLGSASPSWASLGKNTEVDSHSFLQGIFSTQELNLHLLHLQSDSSLSETPGMPESHFRRAFGKLRISCVGG